MPSKHRKKQPTANKTKTPVSGTRIAVWILAGILALIVLVIGGVGGFAITRLNDMQLSADDIEDLIQEGLQDTSDLLQTDAPEELEGLEEITDADLEEVKVDVVESVPSIKNYMLFGVDSRKVDQFSGLSDVMIMVTVDTKNGAIKLTSFARDILLRIEGYGQNRLNIIYKYKGPEEACKAIESLSGVPIDGYGIMNFYTVAKVIDICGGVDIADLSDAERKNMNGSIGEMNQYTDEPVELVKETGAVHLNGLQAVGYMRIRKVGGGDSQRTERQRTVIAALFDGVKNMELTDMLSLVTEITPYVKTNLGNAEIISLAKDVFTVRNAQVEQMRMPVEGEYYYAMYNNMSIIKIDVEANAAAVQKFVFGE